jgi:hypothetical protein
MDSYFSIFNLTFHIYLPKGSSKWNFDVHQQVGPQASSGLSLPLDGRR